MQQWPDYKTGCVITFWRFILSMDRFLSRKRKGRQGILKLRGEKGKVQRYTEGNFERGDSKASRQREWWEEAPSNSSPKRESSMSCVSKYIIITAKQLNQKLQKIHQYLYLIDTPFDQTSVIDYKPQLDTLLCNCVCTTPQFYTQDARQITAKAGFLLQVSHSF